MKVSIITAFLAVMTICYSQADRVPEYVNVNWIVGTEKTVYQTDSTIIYRADSLFISTGTSSNYKIKIVSKRDTVYEVLFKQININPDFSLKSEMINTGSIQEMMEIMVAELQQKFVDLEYSFLVNKNTGQAFDVKNQEDLGKTIEEMVVTILDNYVASSKINIDEKKKNEIKRKVSELMKEKMTPIMNTMMNSFNYIFQAYSFPYTLGQTLIVETMVYDIDEVKHGSKESPANIVINSSLRNSKLNIDYKYDYDKESAYQQYIVSKGREKEIPINQFEIDERVVANFDLKSTWITDSTSFTKVKMGDIRVNQTSRVTFK
ncbi:MAG: hypothetical protein K0S23_397 [Fluviicola sp.]|jgi:hypothetical protein|uniref:hypothetical protein n=1 Tax=Fluviicola sp. TaxID=1917219 RepID=UPI002632BECE|nr:hypothetical protein [Fluviicola sp.]MDF3026090.1 hypothetical protein [Fluviicola sp.]